MSFLTVEKRIGSRRTTGMITLRLARDGFLSATLENFSHCPENQLLEEAREL
jgi:hypothetical protein